MFFYRPKEKLDWKNLGEFDFTEYWKNAVHNAAFAGNELYNKKTRSSFLSPTENIKTKSNHQVSPSEVGLVKSLLQETVKIKDITKTHRENRQRKMLPIDMTFEPKDESN